jgi:hypothetical protein
MRANPKVALLASNWHLASGDFAWFRCQITEIEYDQSGM